ncbi:MAG: OmpA family protein, partial [Bacteroidota bacterium]|nr:OmpA family protein [Bacteroidota bacterium]
RSDPRARDTDGDGLEDGDEVHIHKTDPASADSDGDGLSDGEEVLKYKTDPLRADSDGDGRSDGSEIGSGSDPYGSDSDGDGIVDGEDRCPAEAETRNGYRDEDGCPDALPLTRDPLSPGQKFVLEGVEFEEGSATLTAAARLELQSALQTLRDHPALRVEIGGHTDSKGADEANRVLSELRAEAVKVFLAGEGVEAARMEVKGYGETAPRDSNGTEAGRARNRRIEFTILSVE